MPSQSAPAPNVEEPDLSLPGLEVQADAGFLPPPPGSTVTAVAGGDDPEEPEGVEELPVEELTEEEEETILADRAVQDAIAAAPVHGTIDAIETHVEPAKAEAPPERPASVVDSPEYQRLLARLNIRLDAITRRQRAAEKNILVLALAVAFVMYQLQKRPAAELVEEIAAPPAD